MHKGNSKTIKKQNKFTIQQCSLHKYLQYLAVFIAINNFIYWNGKVTKVSNLDSVSWTCTWPRPRALRPQSQP